MGSEVSFPRFWGVVCIAKCFRFFVSVIGSAVSDLRFFFTENESLDECLREKHRSRINSRECL